MLLLMRRGGQSKNKQRRVKPAPDKPPGMENILDHRPQLDLLSGGNIGTRIVKLN